eukprot:5755450-Amphidinium_carterae.1
MQSFLAARELSAGQAASLRGKLLFTEAQHYGMVTMHGSDALGAGLQVIAPCRLPVGNAINDELEWALKSFVQLLQTAPSRTISFRPAGRPYIICTDGACEGVNFSDVTVGGTLVVPD